MIDHKISSIKVAAGLLWITGLVLIVWDVLTVTDVGELGLYATCAAGVLNIRHFFCDLGHRERNAFEVGREYEAGARVRTLR